MRLYYEEHGEGVPILCIHGTSSSALVWAGAVEKLARLGRVIAYDRRGCTRSERPEPYKRVDVADHADDAAALLDALGAEPAVIIGRSYGGEVATDLALRHPERVRASDALADAGSPVPSARAALRAPRAWLESHRRDRGGLLLVAETIHSPGWSGLGRLLGEAREFETLPGTQLVLDSERLAPDEIAARIRAARPDRLLRA